MGDMIRTDVDAAVEAGKQALEVEHRIDFVSMKEIEGGDEEIPVALTRNGEQLQPLGDVIRILDERAATPRRRKGEATFAELDSFVAHVNRFKDADSVIFADVEDPTLTAVLDYHRAGDGPPRWGQHRSVYSLPLSREWLLWTGQDDKPMRQDAFAQFIEDHMDDLRAPDDLRGLVNPIDVKDLPTPADVLTMARNLVVRSKGEFARSFNPVTGESSLVNRFENETTSTKIPRAFLLGIPVFEAGAIYALEARMRLDMSSGLPTFRYSLNKPDVVKRDAFNEVRQMAGERTALPVLAGSPE